MEIKRFLHHGAEQLIASINIQTTYCKEPKFAPSFEGEYYAVSWSEKQIRADCPACGGKGKITGLDGKEYMCPACKGDWRNKAVVGVIKQWYIKKYKLKNISISNSNDINSIKLEFEQANSESRYSTSITIRGRNIETMTFDEYCHSEKSRLQYELTDNYAEALAEIKRLNKEEKEKSVNGN